MKSNFKNEEKQTEILINEDSVGFVFERIKNISCGRALNPWLMSIGWNSSDATRVKKGYIPGATKLQQLAEAENVNLTWLLNGTGQPYVVEHYLTDYSASRRVYELLGQAVRGRVMRVLEPRAMRWLLVISAFLPGKTADSFAILAGTLGANTEHAIQSLLTARFERSELEVDPVVFAAIVEGRVSRPELTGAAGAGLPEARPVKVGMKEQSPGYRSARDELHDEVERLPDQAVEHWLSLLRVTKP